MSSEINHKKEFQIERMILFTDAVFAIAITLLVIEIKAPHVEDKLDLTLFNELMSMIPKFIGFIISFFLIGQYWVTHHKLFGFIENYNGKLLWMNLFFLLTIVTMPFSSALYSENVTVNFAFIVYCLNVIASGIFNLLLWRLAGNPKYKLSVELSEKQVLNFFTYRASIVPLIFLLAIPLSFLNQFAAKLTPFLIFPLLKLGNRKFKDVSNRLKELQ